MFHGYFQSSVTTLFPILSDYSNENQVGEKFVAAAGGFYFSAAHILSRKGMKGMKPSSSAGSQSSFIRDLASSLVSFSPRLVRRRNSSWDSMVLSSFLSYSFRISTKSWKPPWSLESLQALYMGNTSALVSIFWPFSAVPPISAMVLRVGFRLQARMRSPA